MGDKDRILAKLEEVAEELEKEMRERGWSGKTVTLKYKLDTYQGNLTYRYHSNRAHRISSLQSSPEQSRSTTGFPRRKTSWMCVKLLTISSYPAFSHMLQAGKELLKSEFPLSIRLIGLRVTKLKDLRENAEHGIKRVSGLYGRQWHNFLMDTISFSSPPISARG